MAGRNSNNSKLDKLIRLADQNEKRWEKNEERWEKNEKRWMKNDRLWKKLADYIRRSEADRKAILKRMDERDKEVDERMERNQQEIVHLRREFRRWMKEQ